MKEQGLSWCYCESARERRRLFCLVNTLGKHGTPSLHYERLRNTESFCPSGVSVYTEIYLLHCRVSKTCDSIWSFFCFPDNIFITKFFIIFLSLFSVLFFFFFPFSYFFLDSLSEWSKELNYIIQPYYRRKKMKMIWWDKLLRVNSFLKINLPYKGKG